MARHSPELTYLAGDHHVHSVYSPDAKYTVAQLAAAGAEHGLAWMVFAEHGTPGWADVGARVQLREIRTARRRHRGLLLFQGLEWNVPGGEHATVLALPGPRTTDLLTRFARSYDRALLARDSPVRPELAVTALERLGVQGDVLVLLNHPMRHGANPPHRIRDWFDAAPDTVVGWEGAPGAQGAAIPGWRAPDSVRGEYENGPSARSWPGYPPEAYVTHGGFDWTTATVGGLWDALLSEGRRVGVTANSDVHGVVRDHWHHGEFPPGRAFDDRGRLPDPVRAEGIEPGGSDLWPGQFSRTHVGVTRPGYRALMDGLRLGRVWVDHGWLVDGLDVRLHHDSTGDSVTLGGRLTVRRGDRLTLEVTVIHGTGPRLAHLDVIQGVLGAPGTDRDRWRAPRTRVTHTFEPGRAARAAGSWTLRVPFGPVEEPTYLRLRGSDGNRHGPGPFGAAVDPHGPLPHRPGDGDPWQDTWCYTNPLFVHLAGECAPGEAAHPTGPRGR
ncbi:histidinol-phosphatase [Kitasatospora phosalacinea]|uniref:histidinol-phosphatase n=1 Tax=Kitasatospora phosalacinea TaxID=2065 RepID=UPI003658F5AA